MTPLFSCKVKVVEEASWSISNFLWKLKAGILKLKDLRPSEFSAKLDGPNERDRWSFLVITELGDPLAT